MMSRTTQFQYRAWPVRGMPHVQALHHLFGLGVAEIRIDTYILSPNRPQWLMILRGGTRLEIKMKTSTHGPVSGWTTVMKSPFPLRGSVVAALQEAFPGAQLPAHIFAPADLISWLGESASVTTVSKQMVHFERTRGTAELTQVDIRGRRAETFCLRSHRYETLIDTVAMMPGPRLPDVDYGSWLLGRVLPPLPEPAAAIADNDDARMAAKRLSLSRSA